MSFLRLRLASLALLSTFAFTACGKKQSAPSDSSSSTSAPSSSSTAALTKITVQLDWVAEPEHGGFYQALARGFFREENLDVTLIPGGPNAFATQKVASGQAQFAQADSTNTILAIAQGIPVINFAAVFQNDPSVLMLHSDNPVARFEDLAGKTIMARPEWAFIPYVKKKYGIEFGLIPQNFSLANFVADKNFIQQAFYIAEPFNVAKESHGTIKTKYLYPWDAGFDAYVTVIANKPWLAKNPDAARAFYRAYVRGWQDYLEGDPAPAHALMKKANPAATDDYLAFSRQMIIDEKLVIGRTATDASQIGRLSPARFQTQLTQLRDLDILKKALTVDDVLASDSPAAK
ncbi:myristoyl transferase [Nibricoccus aquaticus]|uniref:Myristoyl transferase n=1 Tax=Nibricoccus aquaticus TaxID=2576891 RepID=A0A290Q606_9BACT|nr:ABC transporter substrate-binding protein [Nibricoccus aquaticus]ATC62610.1 myristoyl transferase [Nibricoccus aquaticus]